MNIPGFVNPVAPYRTDEHSKINLPHPTIMGKNCPPLSKANDILNQKSQL
jgi:hypothetical protein